MISCGRVGIAIDRVASVLLACLLVVLVAIVFPTVFFFLSCLSSDLIFSFLTHFLDSGFYSIIFWVLDNVKTAMLSHVLMKALPYATFSDENTVIGAINGDLEDYFLDKRRRFNLILSYHNKSGL